MRRMAAIASTLGLLGLVGSGAGASPVIRLTALTRPEPTVTLELTATNDGDEPAGALHPEVLFEQHSFLGDLLPRLAPGASHRWELHLIPAPGPGTFPLTVRVPYQRVDGTRDVALIVTTVATADASPSGVRTTLGIPPLTHVSNVRLTLENPLAERVAGRLVVLLPPPLYVNPESQPLEVEGGGRTELPLVIERRGAPARTFPLFALFEFVRQGTHHTILASGDLVATVDADADRRPFWIAASALGVTLALLAFALWWSARRVARDREAT